MTIEDKLRHWLSDPPAGFPSVFLVGGAVRDLLLDRQPHDLDLVCPDAAKAAELIGQTRNVAVVKLEKKTDEPCYRIVERNDPLNFIDLAVMRGKTLDQDLRRRDFTINAMARRVGKEGRLGRLIDPLKGNADLARKCIRITGPQAFPSDPLRVLRAVRFAAELGFAIEENTLIALQTNAGLLDTISPERIWAELLRILEAPDSASFVVLLDQAGILNVILPEIIPMKGCIQNSFHHKDVWQHSLMVFQNCEAILGHLDTYFGKTHKRVAANLATDSRAALLKLATLLHDVGKPSTRGTNPRTGRITFYGHDRKGSEMVRAIAARLRFSNLHGDYVATLVAEHLRVLNLSDANVNKTTRLRWFRKLKSNAVPVIVLGMADIKGTLGPDASEFGRIRQLNWSRQILGEYFETIEKRLESKDLITGRDLLAIGLSPGPAVGRILKKVREAQDDGAVIDRQGAINLAQRLYNTMGPQKEREEGESFNDMGKG